MTLFTSLCRENTIWGLSHHRIPALGFVKARPLCESLEIVRGTLAFELTAPFYQTDSILSCPHLKTFCDLKMMTQS